MACKVYLSNHVLHYRYLDDVDTLDDVDNDDDVETELDVDTLETKRRSLTPGTHYYLLKASFNYDHGNVRLKKTLITS